MESDLEFECLKTTGYRFRIGLQAVERHCLKYNISVSIVTEI